MKYFIEQPKGQPGLWLCTKDIKPGDDVYEPGLEHEGLIKVVESMHTVPEQPNYMKPPISWIVLDHAIKGGAYKVIGEVSHGATWVKKGMKFDESDIQLFALQALYGVFEFPLSKIQEWIRLPADVKNVQFRCPNCKTFH